MSEFVVLTSDGQGELVIRIEEIASMKGFGPNLTKVLLKQRVTLNATETPKQILKKIEEAQNGGTLPGAQTEDIQPSSRAEYSRLAAQELSEGQ